MSLLVDAALWIKMETIGNQWRKRETGTGTMTTMTTVR
jgi:hypothetical protein